MRSLTAESNWGQAEQDIVRLCEANSVVVGTRRGLPVMLDGEKVGCAHEFVPVPPSSGAFGLHVDFDGYLKESHVRYDVDLTRDIDLEGRSFEVNSTYDGRQLVGCTQVDIVKEPKHPKQKPKPSK